MTLLICAFAIFVNQVNWCYRFYLIFNKKKYEYSINIKISDGVIHTGMVLDPDLHSQNITF